MGITGYFIVCTISIVSNSDTFKFSVEALCRDGDPVAEETATMVEQAVDLGAWLRHPRDGHGGSVLQHGGVLYTT
jgi:hypothetical protein